jgi:hypothetical protein
MVIKKLKKMKKFQDQSLVGLKKHGEVTNRLNLEKSYIIQTLKVLL